jgi:hypothetical protein
MRMMENCRASFDRLRIRGNLRGPKKKPHAEPVEARTTLVPAIAAAESKG